MTRLVIVGAGGFGRETREVVRALQAAGAAIELIGYVDDDPTLAGSDVGGVPVLGPIETIADHPDAAVVVTTGHPGNYFSRPRIVGRLGLPRERYATLIHPKAVVPPSVAIGAGSVLHAGVVVTADVVVGDHVVVMPSVTLTHDDRIGDFVTFGAGARLAGDVTVERGAYIGAGALIRERLTIGMWALIGMGSVVTRDVPAAEVWVGTRARRIRTVTVPADLR